MRLVTGAIAVLVVAAGMHPTAAGGAGRTPGSGRSGAPTVTVTDTGLVDFQPVHVTGSGFEPNALLEYYECRGGAVTDADCDGFNADFVDTDAAGNVDVVLYVDARIYLPDGTEVDCRTDPAGCEVGVGFMVDAGQWPSAHLDFDPTAPLLPVVSATATPTTDLRDGTVVHIDAAHLSFREEAFAYLCAIGDGALGARCDIDRWVRTVPAADGTARLDLTVFAGFDPPLDDPIDCRTAPAGCEIQVSWSFGSPPDRLARIPVTFAPAPPASSSTTTTTTVPTTTPATPAPAPAAPVDATASYTG